MALDKTNLGIIDVNAQNEPGTLSGLLNLSLPNLYDCRKDGRLPANTNATYKECIHHYIDFYKSKVSRKSGTMYEAKIAQDIKNGIAKEELTWLEVKKQKEHLIEIEELNILFLPIFHIVKSNLVNLTRKYPEIQYDIDRTLSSWQSLGSKIVEKANKDSQEYIQQQLDRDISLKDAEEQVLNNFGIDELL